MRLIETLVWVRPVHLLATLFFAILFLQSGLDKVQYRRGNLEFLTAHFSKSIFKDHVTWMFPIITITEVLAGVFCALGFIFLLFWEDGSFALYGLELAAVNLVMLFMGQRVAKDYAGAATLVPYFFLALFGIGLFLDL